MLKNHVFAEVFIFWYGWVNDCQATDDDYIVKETENEPITPFY